MSFNTPFSDPIISKKRKGTPDDPYLDVTELVNVINGQAVLTEIPLKFNRVKVTNQQTVSDKTQPDIIDGGQFPTSSETATFSGSTITAKSGIPYYEIENAFPTENQYTVDYVQGVLTFHPSKEGNTFVVTYKGTGTHYFPSSRVWTKDNGNGTVETLDDVVTAGSAKITEITAKITEANQAAIDARNAATNLSTISDESKVIIKTSIATYADIVTTYPSPQVGWLVTAKDTKIQWRWNGSQWQDVGLSDSKDGFNVVVGSLPPVNVNTLWINAPETNRNATVITSSTPPTDTSAVWWKLD